jgi:hypothetical protein
MTRRLVLCALVLAVAPACKRHRHPGGAEHAARPADEAPVAAGGGGGEGGGGGSGGGGGGSDDDGDEPAGGRRFHDASVYVDGVPVVAFTYNEMPAGVKIYKKEWDEGEFYSHFLVCDYFKQLGVDCAQVKETHWYAGRSRVAIITGAELRKNRDKLYFNFTRELGGKPRVEWSGDVRTNDHVDLVSDLAIYVHKKPPRWDRDAWTLRDEHGEPIDGIPYLKEDGVKNGVRVNVDGRLAAHIKRNLLDGNVAPLGDAPDGSGPRYALTAFLRAKGIDVAGASVRGVDLITRDERVLRVTGADAAAVSFAAPRGRHGEVMAYFGAHYAPVIALSVYAKSPVPDRAMRTYTLRGDAAAGGAQSSQAAGRKTQGRRGSEGP